MKSVVADYRYRILCLRIVPVTGSPIYLTDHPRDLVMSGHTYLSTAGYQFTGQSATAGLLAGIGRHRRHCRRLRAVAGRPSAAACSTVRASTSSRPPGRRPSRTRSPSSPASSARPTLLDHRFQIGGVSLIDALGQTVGQTYGAQCPKTFCGTGVRRLRRVAGGQHRHRHLTSVTSARCSRDSARTEAADIFGAGTIQFTSGPNAGLKRWRSRAMRQTARSPRTSAFYYLPAIGNAYSMVRGCRKRLSDCQARWNGSERLERGELRRLSVDPDRQHLRAGRQQMAAEMTADDIIAAARQCLGTPFRHQGRLLSFGLDCAGVAIHVARQIGVGHLDVSGYGRTPANGQLERSLDSPALSGARRGSTTGCPAICC
jgi:hypothetical protein